MSRKQPCRICGRWYLPDPRARAWQRTCERATCRRERHRRSCASWHERNPDYDREERLRRRLRLCELPATRPVDPLAGSPLLRLNRQTARDAVGLEVIVVLEETGQVLWQGVRDAVRGQALAGHAVSRRVPLPSCRDDIARAP
jgi:hypothetical protein